MDFSRFTGELLRAGQLLNGNAKAMLIPEGIGVPVQFSFNPEQVQVSRTAKNQGSGTTVGDSLSMSAKETSPVTITLNGARLTGAVVTQAAVDQLLDWCQPRPTIGLANRVGRALHEVQNALRNPGRAMDTVRDAGRQVSDLVTGQFNRFSAGRNGITAVDEPPTFVPSPGSTSSKSYQLPVLLFMWGVGGPLGNGTKVQLTAVSVDYQRFDWTGIPVMAKVNMTLQVHQAELPGTNPSSGGIPGRGKHVLTQGEDVVRVATQAYGTPAAWRAVAEANGIDDPLRVRPGRVLHLPAPTELGQEVPT
ncbi:LysM peptidoglycan-binding domain-containing protein [Actinokineospora bangkokensis]|uniref:LysM domain-containing protein n=1 Tax=Actinokineospora bangkokensis TaxID=1193682 RepID=A0A1Q9LK72_9PSEU|nr:hypothetical protein [Actinokineospora bangkokensis]OLR92394.1 hypothetical protein BJP25_20115 [Actinokineospora bangkokensis]